MESFSPHLFWDTEAEQVDIEKHQTWLVKRVLEKGLWSDWQLLLLRIGKQRVRKAIKNMPDLNPRALSFACVALNLNPYELRCSTRKPCHTTPWPY